MSVRYKTVSLTITIGVVTAVASHYGERLAQYMGIPDPQCDFVGMFIAGAISAAVFAFFWTAKMRNIAERERAMTEMHHAFRTQLQIVTYAAPFNMTVQGAVDRMVEALDEACPEGGPSGPAARVLSPGTAATTTPRRVS